jgi:hypothetical protein
LLLLIGVGLAALSYFIARRINLGTIAFLPPLLFMTLVFRDRLDATHHWFSEAAILAAVAVLMDGRSNARVALAGALCGVAACFTQTLGFSVLVALAIFLFWESRRASKLVESMFAKQSLLAGCFAGVVLLVTYRFIQACGLHRFISSTLIFSLRYYSTYPGANSWQGYMAGIGEFLHWRQLPDLFGFLLIHALLPLMYILFFVRYRRDSATQTEQPWERLMLISLVGGFSLLSVVAAPTWARLYYVSLPALIVFAWILKCDGRVGQLFSRSLLAFSTALMAVLPLAKQLHDPAYLDLPVGRTAFLNRNAYDRYLWAASQMRSGDFFFGGLFPDFYFILNLRNPGPVAFITPYEYTRPEEVQALLAGLDQHQVRILLWTPMLDLPSNPQGDHLRPLRRYIRDHYHLSQTFPNYQAWARND